MNDVLTQRLAGALIIIALGVFLWPRIFTDFNRPSLDRRSQVPPIPSLKEMQLQPPQPVADIDPAGGRYDAQLQAEARELERLAEVVEQESATGAATEVAAGPALDQRGIPIAWVLQVVTVARKDRAQSLVGELTQAGYKAYFRPTRQGDKTLYRVSIGPRFEREAVRQLKLQVDKEMGVNSIIARYVP